MDTKTAHCCYHCELPVTTGDRYQVRVLGELRLMCCPGCQAVAESIVGSGMEDYYRFRTESGKKGDAHLPDTLAHLKHYDEPLIQEEFVVEENQQSSIQLTVEGINCAACAWLIEKQLTSLAGLIRVNVNVSAQRVLISWDKHQLKLSDILSTLERFGYHGVPFQPDSHEEAYQQTNKQFLKKLGLTGLMTMQVMMLAVGLYFGLFGYIASDTKQYFHWISLLLTVPVVTYGGAGFYRNAYYGLKGRVLNMDVSVSLAILGTFAASAWATITGQGNIYFESVCMFIFFLLLSRYLEHRSRHKAAVISANMLKYQPVTAIRIEHGKQHSVLVKQLQMHDEILVKAGETIPVDGVISDGSSYINESMLTGEFVPVDKGIGNRVFGGTLNEGSPLKIRVEATVKHSLVSQIIRLQEQALASKPAVARFADRASQQFVFWVLLIALASFAVWWFIDASEAFWIAIAVLVATCPCALSLATPSALGCAIARLNANGVLVRHADALDRLEDITTVLFDKTGTLTDGHYSLLSASYIKEVREADIKQIVASLESLSEHPVSRAFEFDLMLLPVSDFTVIKGKGISAKVNERQYLLGNETIVTCDIPEKWLHHTLFLQEDDTCIAAFTVADSVKHDAKKMVSFVADKGYSLHILSGDTLQNIQPVGRELGIERIRASQTPELKMQAVQALQNNNECVLMLGDGVNDAPVLANADVSIAVNGASDLAQQSADVLLLNSQLSQVEHLLHVATRARRIIKQNMMWAIGYNVVILPAAVLGFLTPWLAVIGMSLSSLIVVSNSTRLLTRQMDKT